MSHKKGEKAENANKGNPDTLLGDPVASAATHIEKAKEKGQKDKIGIDDIGIFEFIFHGLPELQELKGIKCCTRAITQKKMKKEREI